MPLIFPAGGSSGCRLETLVGRGGERDRIDRSTTFEGCLYSSFPDLRTQRPGVEWRWNGVEWALTQNGPPESGRGGGEIFEQENLTIPSRASFSPSAMRQPLTADLSFLSPLSPTTRVPFPSLFRLSRIDVMAN